jgi:hypothetical protein
VIVKRPEYTCQKCFQRIILIKLFRIYGRCSDLILFICFTESKKSILRVFLIVEVSLLLLVDVQLTESSHNTQKYMLIRCSPITISVLLCALLLHGSTLS